MSHFSVMVICDTSEEVDALLAPFKENDGDCPRQYLEFTDIEEEYREKYEKGSAEYVRAKDNRLLLPWDDEFRVPGAIGIGTNTHEVPDDLPRVEIPYKVLYPSFDDYMSDWCGEEKDDELGKYGYWENPNAKWDWFEIGGRWKKHLKAADGTRCCHGVISELDFSPDEEARSRALLVWSQLVDKVDHGVEAPWLHTEKYLKEGYGSAESYARCESLFRTYAVVTPDGAWHAPGTMGWFGISDETPGQKREWIECFERDFLEKYRDRHVFIVDCHI